MSKRFIGKTAIITGGSRGIGRAIAGRLVADGAKVVVTARKADELDQAVAALGGAGNAIGVVGNADDTDHQAETVARAIDVFGSVDFLVNNVGINPVYGAMIDLDLAVARKVVEVNSIAALSWVQLAHAGWMKAHGGAVVNVSAVAALRAAAGIGLYGSSKAMLNQITQMLAVELAPHIRVNAVAPAVVKTEFAAALYEHREEELAQAYPLKRLGAPEDVGGVVAFLLSDDAAWLTGQLIVVDGGLTLMAGTE